MGIEIARLEEQLLEMSALHAPGQQFCDAIAEMAHLGRFDQLHSVLPAVVYEEMATRLRQDPDVFVASWRTLAREMQQGFVEHARQRLTSLTRLQPSTEAAFTPAWQEIQRALDTQGNDLLRAAFGLELLQLVEPAVRRAAHLRECVVTSASSEEADRYLDEATRCYFLGLYTACAVMCRSVLEEAIKQRLPAALANLVRSRYRNTATLGNLLHEIHNNLQMTGIDAGFMRIANRVNDTGKKAVHCGVLAEDEARDCLQSARSALQVLLK